MRYIVKKLKKGYEVKYVDKRMTPNNEEVEVVVATKEIDKNLLLNAIKETETEQKTYNANTNEYLDTTRELLEEIEKVG